MSVIRPVKNTCTSSCGVAKKWTGKIFFGSLYFVEFFCNITKQVVETKVTHWTWL